MRAFPRPRTGPAAALLSSLLLLQGCASDATFLRPDGSTPDPKQLEADGSACRELWPMVVGFLAGAAWGAGEGVIAGAGGGDAGEGAIIGAGVGAVAGVFIGAYAAASGEAYDRCMAGKGYHRA